MGAGISPGTIAALCERTPLVYQTWLRLIAALGGAVVVTYAGQSWSVAMTRNPKSLINREWAAWHQRRAVTTGRQLRQAHPKLKRSDIEQRATGYARNEEARLRSRLAEAPAMIRALSGQIRSPGLRMSLATIVERIGLKAEELSLLAGVSLSACQLALGEREDGRLATVHRLLSTLGADLRIEFPSASVKIGRAEQGSWRPGQGARGESRKEAPSRGPESNRSRLTKDQILDLYDRNLTIGDIARQAGVSRQRVHKIAMDAGRSPRRAMTRDDRTHAGRDLLGIG